MISSTKNGQEHLLILLDRSGLRQVLELTQGIVAYRWSELQISIFLEVAPIGVALISLQLKVPLL